MQKLTLEEIVDKYWREELTSDEVKELAIENGYTEGELEEEISRQTGV